LSGGVFYFEPPCTLLSPIKVLSGEEAAFGSDHLN